MERYRKINHLVEAIDGAIACAEQLDLTLAVHILEVARLEVDQAKQSNVEIMPTMTLVYKRS